MCEWMEEIIDSSDKVIGHEISMLQNTDTVPENNKHCHICQHLLMVDIHKRGTEDVCLTLRLTPFTSYMTTKRLSGMA